MTSLPSRREGGFTLLELLLVIGVAALLLIGGIATYRLVSDGNKTTETTRLLLTVRQEANAMAQQQNGVYTGIAFTGAAGADTASPLVTGGVLRSGQHNPFNGTMVITPTPDAGGVADANLEVTFNSLPQSACTKLMQAINNPSEVVSVQANGGTVYAGATLPVTSANAGAACNLTTATNTITWVFP